MIISISGTPGSGKTTLAKFLASKLKLKLYLVGEMVRDIAEKRNLSIVELDKKALTDKTIDEEIDRIHLRLKRERNFVIDSRIAFKFFPNSLKIFLYCKPEIAAERIFRDKRPSERMSLNKVLSEIKERKRVDVLRYKKYYRIDIDDVDNYDVVIDTSKMNIPEMNRVALKAVKNILRH